MNDSSKRRIITLTNRRPISVIEDEWPIIASITSQEGATYTYSLMVRKHADGRCIAYGTSSRGPSGNGGFRPLPERAGYLLPDDALLERSILDFCTILALPPQTCDDIIASLPPTEL
jgi:hypothetical protein